ncbi:relaxase/mobilization nuclease domain-containing protein [Ectopseudomonas hydrolytica]|uniref:relaxase/mobilization nuclease domain-containing protein n=1 Tax=Ectopseudomonas hydrolytica TaxID=2493633 RepID=UPI003EE14E8C
MISRKFANEKGSSKTRVEYVFGKGHEHKCEQVQLVGGNVTSTAMDDLIEEMDAPCHLRQAATGRDSGKCHMHYMLSLPASETLSPSQWRQVLDKTMSALGYTEDHKFFGMLHHDTDHQHMHIIANRISMSGYKLLSESNDYEILMNVCREIEQEYGLQVVPMPHETFGVNLTREEVEASQKSGDVAWKHKVIARVATALERTQERGGNMLDFIAHLKKAQISVELTADKSGKPTGISYKFEGKSISGRALKRSRFTWQNLIKREGIRYDESMLQELQKAVRTRDAEPAQRPGPQPTKHKGLFVSTERPKVRTKTFAIVIQADRLRRTAISRILEPTYTKGNQLFYVFDQQEKLRRDQLQLKIMNESAIKMARAAMQLVEAILSMFRCNIEIDYSPDDVPGPLYSLENEKAKPKLELTPA